MLILPLFIDFESVLTKLKIQALQNLVLQNSKSQNNAIF